MLSKQANQLSQLVLISTSSFAEQIIAKANVTNWSFDLGNKTFAYLKKDSTGNQLWYLSLVNKTNKQILISGIDNRTKISDDLLTFSPNGKIVYFNIEKPIKQPEANVITDQLKVWSYTDEYPQSTQEGVKAKILENKQTFAYNISSSSLTQITNDSLELLDGGGYNNKYLLLVNQFNKSEGYYRGKDRKLILMNIETGDKKLIAVHSNLANRIQITYEEDYILWYDEADHCYYSYVTESGEKINISHSIGYPTDGLADKRRSRHGIGSYGSSLVAFDNLTERFIINDQFDLWEVDPSGIKKPICLTGQTGRQRGVQFRLILPQQKLTGNSIMLSGFNHKNKDNGLFLLEWNKHLGPKLRGIVPMQASGLYLSGLFIPNISTPQKNANANIFLYAEQKSTRSPNLYVYNGSKTIKLTDFHPEDSFNWLTTELHNYKLADGSINQGILYKPEDFDPLKKYPVIFFYYEILSNTLNKFLKPSLPTGDLTIPWYVSNGYLVFVPDVSHQRPNPGDRIFDCITSAAKYVSALPFVDTKHFGLQGHSYGGYETNLMVAKSNLFAAAQSSAGPSNLTSMYLMPFYSGNPGFSFAESGQLNMPRILWDHLHLYMKDSPVFHADKVTTPLLMMHGAKDGSVPIAQSVEMYFALRRLNKPVWLLEYEGEGHTLYEDNNILDFTIRQQQFFDHYLKGKKMPAWMSRGVPSWEKGIKSGLELDTAQTSK
jgi:dienelactone hydrolase